MTTSSAMTYQQPYQPTVNQPVMVQSVQPLQPVVIPVQTGLTAGLRRNQGIDVGKCHIPGVCVIFLGFFGIGFIVISILGLGIDYAFDHGEEFNPTFDYGEEFESYSPMRSHMFILLTIGVIFSVITVGLCLIAKRNKRIQESHDKYQPVIEPFTQNQMNQGSSMYVPVQSGPGLPYSDNAPSASYSAQMSNVQQPFLHGVDTATGAPQTNWPENASFAEYDQQPAFAPPAYSPSEHDQQPAYPPPAYSDSP